MAVLVKVQVSGMRHYVAGCAAPDILKYLVPLSSGMLTALILKIQALWSFQTSSYHSLSILHPQYKRSLIN